MDTNYPDNLYDYYRKNPDVFEERVDSKKKIIDYALAAIFLLLIIFPSIIPLQQVLLVRIVAAIGLIYFGFSAVLGGKAWYNKASGGKITEVAIKKFAVPERGTVPNGADDQKVLQLFANNDWAGLANEPDANDRPLQLYIHEDAVGKTFYLQLMRYFSSSDFRGTSEVKVIREPQYASAYSIIKSIQSTH
ncbi:MAG: hypothetical protein FWF52_06740 [Candidatus Azobacteroides sp.]|nr:hypothetical protein [Candidatus Azobacteroides sp.]